MRTRNGGIPVNTCFPVTGATGWAPSYIAIISSIDIDYEKLWSLDGDLSSQFKLEEEATRP